MVLEGWSNECMNQTRIQPQGLKNEDISQLNAKAKRTTMKNKLQNQKDL
jgi:hypothetical protein